MPGALSLPGYHLQVVLMMTTLPTNCMSGAAFNILWKTKQPWPSNIPIPLPSELRDKQSWNEPNEQLWMVQSFIANPEKVWRLCGLDGGLCIWADKIWSRFHELTRVTTVPVPWRMEDSEHCLLISNIGQDIVEGNFNMMEVELQSSTWKIFKKDQDENSLENIWVFDFLSVAVRGILHTLIAVIRFEEPRVKLNGLEAGSLYFFQANFFDQITVCGVVRVVPGYLLAPGAGFELTRQQRLESLVGRPMPKPKDGNFATTFRCNLCRADLVQVIWSRQMPQWSIIWELRCIKPKQIHLTPEAPSASSCEAGISVCSSKIWENGVSQLIKTNCFTGSSSGMKMEMKSNRWQVRIHPLQSSSCLAWNWCNFNLLMQPFLFCFDVAFRNQFDMMESAGMGWALQSGSTYHWISRAVLPTKIDLSRRLIISSLDLSSGRYSLDPAEGVDDTITSLHRLSGWKLWNTKSKPKPKPSDIQWKVQNYKRYVVQSGELIELCGNLNLVHFLDILFSGKWTVLDLCLSFKH